MQSENNINKAILVFQSPPATVLLPVHPANRSIYFSTSCNRPSGQGQVTVTGVGTNQVTLPEVLITLSFYLYGLNICFKSKISC